jgi:hypothetical protein
MKIPKQEPWSPVELTSDKAAVFQAIAAGNASEEQQKRFMSWLMTQVCCVNDLEFRPDSFSSTSFASGKRYVGTQLQKHLSASVGALQKREEKKGK